ncbi:M15 family metallopeptidase [Salibacterium qingdaonense]|uniref:Peptidoglycan L-alanyl-D-glutamate endopeptidase CwlK n=1 Tax=Salibacterium qingdaonense TaxID=266892 RepID=A0A1I4HXY3_9BACI|nr:M15 family metallopeptidase [Salibacterium qingdaonense]SFL46677.1 peptidoglycan L-alanyl-D-glutamate endopeptidase CwlK [Salibacterium qingdaonense]
MTLYSGWDLTLIGILSIILFAAWQQEREDHIEEMAARSSLHPEVEKMKQEFVEQTAEQGIDVVITQGYRSKEQQNDLYAQGRSEEGSIVTYARGGESYHNYGLAVDFALRKNNGDVTWNTTYDGNDNGEADWQEAGDIAKRIGFEWGGDWQQFQDFSHLQWNPGVSVEALKDESQNK